MVNKKEEIAEAFPYRTSRFAMRGWSTSTMDDLHRRQYQNALLTFRLPTQWLLEWENPKKRNDNILPIDVLFFFF